VSRTVALVEGGIEVRLTGWTRVGALKSEFTIPCRAVRAVHAGHFEMPGGTIRLGGTYIPFADIAEGHFHNRRGWMFFSYEGDDKTVALELDGFKMGRRSYWLVVLGVENPAEMAVAVQQHCPNLQQPQQP
jgi:hypothetical protein